MVFSFLLCAIVWCFFVTEVSSAVTTLNAVVVGHKGHVNIDEYMQLADIINNDKKSYCRLRFTALEYDTTDGKSVYESLQKEDLKSYGIIPLKWRPSTMNSVCVHLARETFSDEQIAVATGPQIDVFTSTDYVILHQIHFVTSLDEQVEQASRTMPILPDQKSLSRAIGTIIKYLGWKKVAFLSQEDFSPVLALGGEGIFVSPIRLPSNLFPPDDNYTDGSEEEREFKNPQLQQTLTTLRESQMDKFILHSMKKDVVKTVLAADFEDISKDIKGMAKVYGLQLVKKEKFTEEINAIFNGKKSRLEQSLVVDVVGILHDYLKAHVQDCSVEPAESTNITAEQFQTILSNAIPYSGALGTYNWPKVSQKEISNVRQSFSIPIYRYIDRAEQIAQVAFQRKEISVIHFLSPQEPHVENPFKSKTFDVIAKQDEPFVMKIGDRYEGFCVDVLRELSKCLNDFEYRIFELEGRENYTKKSRVWDEIITQLKVGNASMAIGAFAVTAEREAKISFSYTIISSSVSMLLKRPPDTTNYFQFLGPFSTTLWVMIVVFFLAVGFGLFFMARFDSTQDNTAQKFDLKESMWYSLTVLLQGSAEYSPQTTSMRTIIAFFWFCTLVINAAYTANLAAFLTLQQIDNRLKNVDALARQSSVKYGVLNNSDLMYFFKNSREDPYERMWAFMKLNEDVSLLESRKMGLKLVENGEDGGEYVYLDDGVINNYNAQKNCDLESIEQNFGIKHFSMGFPKGAPYRSDINRALLQLKEDGTLDRLREKWWDSKSNCNVQAAAASSKANTASELGITNMFGVFIVLIAFAILAVVFEIASFFYKFGRQRQKKKNEANGGIEKAKSKGNSVQFGNATIVGEE